MPHGNTFDDESTRRIARSVKKTERAGSLNLVAAPSISTSEFITAVITSEIEDGKYAATQQGWEGTGFADLTNGLTFSDGGEIGPLFELNNTLAVPVGTFVRAYAVGNVNGGSNWLFEYVDEKLRTELTDDAPGFLDTKINLSLFEINVSHDLDIQDDGILGIHLHPDIAGEGIKQDGEGNLDLDFNTAEFEILTDQLNILDDAILENHIADDQVRKEHVNADVAGDGLGQNVSGALEINTDSVTFNVVTNVFYTDPNLKQTKTPIKISIIGDKLRITGGTPVTTTITTAVDCPT